MTWIKLDDLLPNHPKVLAAPEAFGLYVAGLCYSSSQGTNGFIPDAAIPRLLSVPKIPRLKALLIEVGLWNEAPGGIQIHAYLKHNRSAEDIAALKAKRATFGSVGGSKRQANAKQVANDLLEHVASKRQADTDTELEADTEKTLKASSQAAPDDLPRFEDFWNPYPRQANGTKPEPKQAKDQWSKLTLEQKRQALAALPHYIRHLEQNPDISPKHAFRWLRDRSFEGYGVAPLELVKGVDPEEQARRLVANAGM